MFLFVNDWNSIWRMQQLSRGFDWIAKIRLVLIGISTKFEVHSWENCSYLENNLLLILVLRNKCFQANIPTQLKIYERILILYEDNETCYFGFKNDFSSPLFLQLITFTWSSSFCREEGSMMGGTGGVARMNVYCTNIQKNCGILKASVNSAYKSTFAIFPPLLAHEIGHS